MRDLLSTLRQRVVVGDGSVGATLFSRLGKEFGTSEEFNLHRPEGVVAMHRDYVAAGAELLTTNTFTANRIALGRKGLSGQVETLNRRAVELAREAAGRRAWVVGSVGPTGELLQPYGDMIEEQAREAYEEQISALAAAGADLIAIETMSATDEARIALEAAREVCDKPVLVSFTIDKNLRTMMGTTVEDFTQAALEWGADIVGSNCGVGPHEVEVALAKMRELAPEALLWGEPNAGLPQMQGSEVAYPLGPTEMADYAERAFSIGARVIGSCCGSTPEYTRAIAERIARLRE